MIPFPPIKTRITPEPSGELFNWTYSDDGSDFDTLSGLSSEVIISECTSNGVKGYQHHAWVEMHPAGFLVSIFSIHDYDEGAPGMYVEWSYSDDEGDTWSSPSDMFPSMDTMRRRSESSIPQSGRQLIPMGIAVINGRCFAVSDVNDRNFGADSGSEINGSRTPIGFVAREIFSNKTLGDVVWIHNADDTKTAPDPVDGFSPYSYDSGIRSMVYNYLFRPANSPKVSFSDQKIYNNQIPNQFNITPNPIYGVLSEPTTIKPNGYYNVWKYWKNSGNPADETYPSQGNGYKVFSFGEDESSFTESVIPDCFSNGAIVTRFVKYGSEIFIIGNEQSGNRERLYFARTSRNTSTGQYDTDNVYQIAFDSDTAPDYTGDGKGGGPQSVDVCISNGKIYFIYSHKKESIRFKKYSL